MGKGLKRQGPEVAELVEKGQKPFRRPRDRRQDLGVVGLGAIGAMVANTALSLGMEVFGYDPYISIDSAWGLSRKIKRANSLKLLFEYCDYLTLHVPLTGDTKYMINAAALSNMKPGMRILNFSRAELVNTDDLKPLLKSGAVACYATDFPTGELLEMENVLAIPISAHQPRKAKTTARKWRSASLSIIWKTATYETRSIFRTPPWSATALSGCACINRNIPNVVGQISSLMAGKGLNIENMLNRSKKDLAYTIIDTKQRDKRGSHQKGPRYGRRAFRQTHKITPPGIIASECIIPLRLLRRGCAAGGFSPENNVNGISLRSGRIAASLFCADKTRLFVVFRIVMALILDDL
jgi:D-3-phosphoglycerate dehydrogenase